MTDIQFIADQVYSRVGGVDRLVDVYLPGGLNSPPPVVLWLHGGGWRFGDRRLAPDLAHFAQQSRLAVVSIDYRLSDEAKFPAPIEDVKTAVRWIRTVASKFGFNGERIGLWGSSAGGHLAACAALSCGDAFLTGEHAGYSSAVQAVVDGYGPTNFARIEAARASPPSLGTDADNLVIGRVLPAGHPDSFESRFLGTPVSTSPAQVELADPVHYMRSGAPPFLILHGEADALIPPIQSRYLFDSLTAAGNEAVLVLFQNLKHGFFNNPHLADEDYGSVTVHQPLAGTRETRWSCDPSTNIPSMVVSFFQSHLQS